MSLNVEVRAPCPCSINGATCLVTIRGRFEAQKHCGEIIEEFGTRAFGGEPHFRSVGGGKVQKLAAAGERERGGVLQPRNDKAE
jgi:hypothetical protein